MNAFYQLELFYQVLICFNILTAIVAIPLLLLMMLGAMK